MYSPEPFHPIPKKEPARMSADEAVSAITSGKNLTLAFGCECHGQKSDLAERVSMLCLEMVLLLRFVICFDYHWSLRAFLL